MQTPKPGYRRVGVTQGGVLDNEGGDQQKASRDLNNDRDLFSPSIAFENDDGQGRLAAFFLAPFIDVGSSRKAGARGYRQDDRVSGLLFLTNMIIQLFGQFFLTLLVLSTRHILNANGTAVGEASFIFAFVSAAAWFTFAGHWPYDDRMKPTLNPALQYSRLFTVDQGLLAVALNIGIQLGGAAIAGAVVHRLGWKTGIVEVNTGTSAEYWVGFFVLCVICITYIFNEKFEQRGEPEHRDWQKTVWGTTGAIFFGTIIAYQFGFPYLNPATSFGAYVANGGWSTATAWGIRDSGWYIGVLMFVPATVALVMYYLVRGLIFADERWGEQELRLLSFRRTNPQRSSDESVDAKVRARLPTSGLRNRRY